MKGIAVTSAFVLTLALSSVCASAQTRSREEVYKEIEAKRVELSQLESKFLEPGEEDRILYAEFLTQPDTGLIRLLPRETFESESYKDNKKSITIRGGGSYYSFTTHTHEYMSTTDMGLERGQLKAGFAGANYGMLTNLGDVPIESITLETPAARVLATQTPALQEPEARVEQRRVSEGRTIDGTQYKNNLPAKVNSTYLVRTINYSASDALVAFRVIRKDTDGSLIIVWKLLEKYRIPQLVRTQAETLR